MIDHGAAYMALRARAATATIATTGSTSLSATATGYARAAGSFLSDGFRVGLEITSVAGFNTAGNNQATTSQGRVITAVDASSVSCSGTAAENAGAGRTIVVGLPFKRALENVRLTPVQGFPYFVDQYVPATHEVLTMPAQSGIAEETGLYAITVYGLDDTGPLGLRKYVQEIMELFTPGTTLVVGSDSLRVTGTRSRDRREPGPQSGQIIPQENGWARCTIRIPWIARSVNLIAA